MTATSLNELRAATASPDHQHDGQDARLEKVRDLLMGDHARETDARIAALLSRIEHLEMAVSRQLDALSARIEALAGSTEADRRAGFAELAKHVEGLSERIRTLSRS